jgi:hypothetical protein
VPKDIEIFSRWRRWGPAGLGKRRHTSELVVYAGTRLYRMQIALVMKTPSAGLLTMRLVSLLPACRADARNTVRSSWWAFVLSTQSGCGRRTGIPLSFLKRIRDVNQLAGSSIYSINSSAPAACATRHRPSTCE